MKYSSTAILNPGSADTSPPESMVGCSGYTGDIASLPASLGDEVRSQRKYITEIISVRGQSLKKMNQGNEMKSECQKVLGTPRGSGRVSLRK